MPVLTDIERQELKRLGARILKSGHNKYAVVLISNGDNTMIASNTNKIVVDQLYEQIRKKEIRK